jgi:hypothetical protein
MHQAWKISSAVAVATVAVLVPALGRAQSVIPECTREQLMPPKFITDGGAPDRKSVMRMGLQAGYLDAGGYRAVQTGLRVELCQIAVQLQKGNLQAAEAFSREARFYLGGLIAAHAAFQARAETERATCLIGTGDLFNVIADVEAKDSELGRIAAKASEQQQGLAQGRWFWDAGLAKVRDAIPMANASYEQATPKSFDQLHALATGTPGYEAVSRQVQAMNDLVDSYARKKFEADVRWAREITPNPDTWGTDRAALANRQDTELRLANIRKTVSDLLTSNRDLSDMDKVLAELGPKLAGVSQANATDLRNLIERARTLIKAKGDVFPTFNELGCKTVAVQTPVPFRPGPAW